MRKEYEYKADDCEGPAAVTGCSAVREKNITSIGGHQPDSNMLPYTIGLFLIFVVQIVLWVVLNLPVGVGTGVWL